MSPSEAAVLGELITLAKSEPAFRTWGKFTDLKKIGTGGFGTVYSAWHPVLHTRVALKIYHAHKSQRPRDELLDEARKLARVRHPNVVVVHDAEEIDGRVGVWMELIEGQTLDDELRDGKRLDAEPAAEVGVALCQALEAVHAAGIVHGDIKAQNVMRSDDGRIVLMDFGAARFRDPQKEASGTRSGTPVYMAPELFKRRGDTLVEPTVQSDVYAVGVLLFFLVTKTFPVKGRTVDDFKQAHEAGEQMLLLADVRPELSEAFVTVVEQALARTPGQRWLTVGEMAGELETFAPGANQPIRLKRLMQAVAVISAVFFAMLAVGFVATRAFEVLLGIERDFLSGTGVYLRVGREAMVPLVFFATIAGVVLGVPLLAIWWLARQMGAPVGRILNSWTKPANPIAAATSVLLVSLAVWGLISWTFSDVFGAIFSLESDSPFDVSTLSTGRYAVHVGVTGLFGLVVGLTAWLWFPRLERQISHAQTVRLLKWATSVAAFLAIASVTLPRRIVWETFEVVLYQNREAYVVAATDEELFLVAPRDPQGAYGRVPVDHPELVRTVATRRLFEESAAAP